MESPRQKVLYEIRNHASLPFVPRYPPLPQVQDKDSCFLTLRFYTVLHLTFCFVLMSEFRQMQRFPKEGFDLLSL